MRHRRDKDRSIRMDQPMPNSPERLSAGAARRAIAAGKLSAVGLMEACLARIAARNGTVAAWSHLEPEAALAAARAADASPSTGLLKGIPFGVKDIIDSFDQPACYGSPIYTGHRPGRDAATVVGLRAQGAVLLGKTVTTEFANRRPGPTRNPHDPGRTPGGSSSGSAAAVADFQVPIALGTQTGGSVLRPAAYCGVVGFKPSFQHFGNSGVRANTEAYDTVGVMARAVEDIALARAAIMDIPYRSPSAPSRRRIAITRTPHWDRAEPAQQAALEQAGRVLAAAGVELGEFRLPEMFDGLEEAHRIVCGFESVRNYADELSRSGHLVSADFLAERVSVGERVTLQEFRDALRLGNRCRTWIDAEIASQGWDALLTPPAPGEAPAGLTATGSAMFNYIWTNMAMPAITLPFCTGPNGLPLGIQLVARRHEDAALLDIAFWAETALAG